MGEGHFSLIRGMHLYLASLRDEDESSGGFD
jgi:hypothetical protein